ncbi:MAG: trimethylamine methyltransferase family protein [Methanobacteriota archaeon]|nr:MAG: trimethylamine methyltransferase family protein [Euryarchaeota archaeon]
MAKARLGFLDKDEIERVYGTALRILEEVGVKIGSEEVTRVLAASGARTSDDGERMFFSEDLVKWALKAAPKSVLLAGTDASHDITIPSEERRMYVANGGEGVSLVNMLTDERRPTRTEDLRDFAILVDELPQVDFFWPMVGALEQPSEIKEVVEFKTSLEWSSKHIQSGAMTAQQARKMLDMAGPLVDGGENLARRPIFSAVQCPISPLSFERGLIEAQVAFSRAGIPIVAMSASVAGLTSPVTISGTVAQTTAENLASLIVTQAAKEGAPFIFSSDSSPGDLKSGSIDYGALETSLFRAAAGQVGEYLRLPKMVAGIGLENLSVAIGNIWEGVAYVANQSLIPSDLGSGLGGTDQAVGASLEQLVLDAWVWDAAKEFARDFDFGEGAISFDTIKAAGLDGNFLAKRHTSLRFRGESVATRIPCAALSSRLEASSRKAAITDAREEALRILGEAHEPKLDSTLSEEIDRIMRA